jgi:hypothetical protein
MKTKIFMLLSILYCISATAQGPLYGSSIFTHTLVSNPSYFMDAGFYSDLFFPGHVMAGRRNVTFPTSPVCTVYKTALTGSLSPTVGWVAEYFFSSQCTGVTSPVVSLAHVDVLEVDSTTNSANYSFVITAANNEALFFGTFKNGGAVTVPSGLAKCYLFPTTGSTWVSGPTIINSITDPDHYYITGSYLTAGNTYMYLLEVDFDGSVLNSATYDVGSSKSIKANDILQSPLSGFYLNELVVVGTLNRSGTQGDQGFVLWIDPTSLTTYTLIELGATGVDQLNTIYESSSGSYLLGGVSDIILSTQQAWVASIDPAGSPLNWSNIYPLAAGSGAIVSLTERPNSYSSNYDIYALGRVLAADADIIKVDPSGALFSQVGNTTNEFQFLEPSSPGSLAPNSLDFRNGSVGDNGLFMYGTGNTNFFMSDCYFNGVVENSGNCSTLTANSYTPQFGPTTSSGTLTVTGGLSACSLGTGLNFTQAAANRSVVCGGSPSYISGNNSRPTQLNNKVIAPPKVFPNPAVDVIYVVHPLFENNPVQISLINATGATVAEIKSTGNQNGTVQILTPIGLSPGIYLIKGSESEFRFERRVIIE